VNKETLAKEKGTHSSKLSKSKEQGIGATPSETRLLYRMNTTPRAVRGWACVSGSRDLDLEAGHLYCGVFGSFSSWKRST
jgi:hypothetical protein